MAAMKNGGKFVIKPYQHNAQMNKEGAMDTWTSLDAAITQIHQQNASSLSFEELYRKAYNMVLYKHGKVLYDSLNDKVSKYLETVADKVAEAEDPQLLARLIEQWGNHRLSMGMIRDILMYMDRTYVPKEKLKPVYDQGMHLWIEKVLREEKLKSRIETQFLDAVRRERLGEDIDRVTVKKIVQMFVDINKEAYVTDVEHPLLVATCNFFKHESQEFINSNSLPEYLKRALMWIEEEKKRADVYLDASTKPKLLAVVYKELLRNHLDQIIENETSGCAVMMQDEKWEDLGRMYKMLGYIKDEGHPRLCEALKAYVDQEGMTFVKDPGKATDAVVYVEGLLAMQLKYSKLIDQELERDKKFTQAFNGAFEHFVNENQKSPEFLSLYVNHLMRKGLKGLSDEEADESLNSALGLFRFLQEKDMFEKYYKIHLASRLLGGKRADDDFEGTFLSKLKAECGVHFISKMEGMFNDTRQTDEMMEAFHQAVPVEELGGVDLTVSVLTQGSWPMKITPSITLPEALAHAEKKFEAFYVHRHTNRKLSWLHSHGTADLKAHFPKKRYTLSVPTYMMAILMLFSERDELSYGDIREMTQIPAPELDRHLACLVLGKSKLLLRTKEGPGKGGGKDKFEEAEILAINPNFSSSHTKVKISVSKSTSGERDPNQTRQVVLEDRKHEIDAAVVRIMKSRRTLHHNLLLSEVITVLSSRFKPDPRDIKKRIEHLIEREFLERGEADVKLYSYLA